MSALAAAAATLALASAALARALAAAVRAASASLVALVVVGAPPSARAAAPLLYPSKKFAFSYAGYYVLLVGMEGEHYLVKDPGRKEVRHR